jgi:AcrR family transcriptional regulator
MSTLPKRRYESSRRAATAGETRDRILQTARSLFSLEGIDQITIVQIADQAGVSASTVYSLFKSKSGILRALMTSSLFGDRFRVAHPAMAGETNAIRMIAKTAAVASAIYEAETADLGLMRGSAAFSSELKAMEREFEALRLEMQEPRVDALFDQNCAKSGLEKEAARQLLWMYTSRDIYRMLVIESGWTPMRYRQWLSATLLSALTNAATVAD